MQIKPCTFCNTPIHFIRSATKNRRTGRYHPIPCEPGIKTYVTASGSLSTGYEVHACPKNPRQRDAIRAQHQSHTTDQLQLDFKDETCT